MGYQASMGPKRAIVLLSLLAAAMPRITLAAEDDTSNPEERMAVFMGVHDWSALGDLQSADEGSFRPDGFNLAVTWHRSMAEFQRTTLLVGGELGLFSNDSDIRGLIAELSSRGMYLMPSLKFALGRQRNFYLDAGAGLYVVDFAELDCDPGCSELDVVWKETAFAGYLGISADLRFGERWAVALEAKVHFVNFGEVTGLGPESQSLDGPIYMIQVGAAF